MVNDPVQWQDWSEEIDAIADDILEGIAAIEWPSPIWKMVDWFLDYRNEKASSETAMVVDYVLFNIPSARQMFTFKEVDSILSEIRVGGTD